MSMEINYHARRLLQIGRRKFRTLIQGPPQHPDFIKAVHYFADGWALNMWQVLDPRKVDSDLSEILRDGFNTIILVVPWRGFQLDQLEPSYDEFYSRQLRCVLAAADRLGLSVIVRVAYSHQILNDTTLTGITQAQRLLLDSDTRVAWLDYLGRLYEICHGFRSFRMGFLCWEEFWHAFRRWQLYKPATRRQLAKSSGYSAFLSNLGVDGVAEIPRPEETVYNHYHSFANARIREMYELALTAFPGLSMEMRVDKDRLQGDGEVQWMSNDRYLDLDQFRFSYWAPFMGAENVGEQLDADEATNLLSHMLDEVSDQGRCFNHVIDQFNFVDSAPNYKGVHAEIAEQEVAPFLQLAAPLLRQMSRGYGVWAYRDYRQNILYNARFLMGLDGWQVLRGSCKPLRRGGVKLGKGSLLRQDLPPKVAGLSHINFDSFSLQIDLHKVASTLNLEVRINASPWLEVPSNGEGKVLLLEYPVDRAMIMEDGLILEFRNNGSTLEIYTVWLYHYIFRGDIRLEDGKPSKYHQALVAFNSTLDDEA